jgi:predicted aldo/keto reductase-like oxidoreductase
MFGKEENYDRFLSPEQKTSSCVECGKCESHCPQGISIREELKNVRAIF